MTQQINLLLREAEEKRGPLLLTALGMVVFVALLIGYWQLLRTQNATLEKQVKTTAGQLATEKAAVKTMKEALATRMDPVRVAAELAALKSRAAESQEIVDRLNRGELGTLDGYGAHFVALAKIGEPGLWLTNVKIANAGRLVEIGGQSLQAESVLRYAGEVNRQVAGFGAAVTSLEMTPITNEKKGTAVAFKLF
jgi:hypothetical protein